MKLLINLALQNQTIMEPENFYYSAYNGSKDFSQRNVRTANATGFGAAADDYAERGIDLNEHLIKNKPATFFMRVNSDAMIDEGIHVGDVVIVDRSLKEKNGSIVIAVVDGDLLIRKLELKLAQALLHTRNKKPNVIEVPKTEVRIWGVMTYVIHSVQNSALSK